MSGRSERTNGEVAQFVTSRNARPFLLTLDIVFADSDGVPRDRGSAATSWVNLSPP